LLHHRPSFRGGWLPVPRLRRAPAGLGIVPIRRRPPSQA
jgi:hypothetical protein